MLVLTRKVGERIHIGEDIVVTVVRIQNDKVRIGIEAPTNVAIHREEVYRRVHAAQAASGLSTPPAPPKAAPLVVPSATARAS
jgi:carbon storage regulator